MNDCLTTLTCVYLHRNTEIVGVGSHLMTPSRPLPDNAWRDRERERERRPITKRHPRRARGAFPPSRPARTASVAKGCGRGSGRGNAIASCRSMKLIKTSIRSCLRRFDANGYSLLIIMYVGFWPPTRLVVWFRSCDGQLARLVMFAWLNAWERVAAKQFVRG